MSRSRTIDLLRARSVDLLLPGAVEDDYSSGSVVVAVVVACTERRAPKKTGGGKLPKQFMAGQSLWGIPKGFPIGPRGIEGDFDAVCDLSPALPPSLKIVFE